MNGGIFGPFKERQEVAEQVQKLKQQGYKEDELIIVADTEERILEEVNGGLRYETLDDQKDFLDRLKAVIFLKTDQEANVEEVQQLLDVSEKEAEVYYEQLKAGNIFIFILPGKMLVFEDTLHEELLDENFEGTPATRIHTKFL
ncbi:general stress protein [Bacillus sp. AGMB 02131]|uniref:General stress protein n=1 Tax=Peribacillus faecalis TaxID=2772559 RepID=A0A927HAH6_9BACI|nr:general stress protein [Peribacillus faecalis]MBD3107934.1 general stress protein [Peribacillus faecalis]